MVEEAIAAFHADGVDLRSLRIDESDVNEAAYELAREGKPEQAKELFRINTLVFPFSANAFDSLGEAYVNLEEKEKAVACLKKALSLNPTGNTRSNSMRLLSQLGVEYEPPKPYEITRKAMDALVGEYDLSNPDRGDNKGFVRIEDGELRFEFVGQPVMAMNPISDVLFTTEAGIHIQFTPATKKQPTQVVLVGRGLRFEGAKKK